MDRNPYVPLALVWQLAEMTETRRNLPAGHNYAHVVLHKGTASSMNGRQINDNADWDVFAGLAVEGVSRMEPDSATLLYSTIITDDNSTERFDYGIMLRPKQRPIGLSWRYAPVFQLMLADDTALTSMKNGVGVEAVQKLLDRMAPPPFVLRQ